MDIFTYAYCIEAFKETPNIPIAKRKKCQYLLNIIIAGRVPFGATSGSSPFRNDVLDLNPFHQFVIPVLCGDAAVEAGLIDGG